MLNWIWLGLVLSSVVYAAFTGRMTQVTQGLVDGSKDAVGLVIGLVGGMIFMLGVIRVAFDGGLRDWIARALSPLLRRLFPEVPPDHPAMGAIVMNMASNMLGLGNAATPFGLKAMSELSKLNGHSQTASDAMVLFLAINTSAITLVPPSGTIFVRAAAGSLHADAIYVPTLIATTCSTLAAVAMFYLLRRLPGFRAQPPGPGGPAVHATTEGEADEESAAPHDARPMGLARMGIVFGALAALALGFALELHRQAADAGIGSAFLSLVQAWSFPMLIVGSLLIGVARRVPIYESMIAGAREGLDVSVRIVPYLVAIMAAVKMLRASGLPGSDDRGDSPLHPGGRRSGRGDADGAAAAALRLGLRSRHERDTHGHGPDSFIGMLDQHAPGVHRDDLLRAGALFRRGAHPPGPPHPGRLPDRRSRGLRGRGGRLPPLLRRSGMSRALLRDRDAADDGGPA